MITGEAHADAMRRPSNSGCRARSVGRNPDRHVRFAAGRDREVHFVSATLAARNDVRDDRRREAVGPAPRQPRKMTPACPRCSPSLRPALPRSHRRWRDGRATTAVGPIAFVSNSTEKPGGRASRLLNSARGTASGSVCCCLNPTSFRRPTSIGCSSPQSACWPCWPRPCWRWALLVGSPSLWPNWRRKAGASPRLT